MSFSRSNFGSSGSVTTVKPEKSVLNKNPRSSDDGEFVPRTMKGTRGNEQEEQGRREERLTSVFRRSKLLLIRLLRPVNKFLPLVECLLPLRLILLSLERPTVGDAVEDTAKECSVSDNL